MRRPVLVTLLSFVVVGLAAGAAAQSLAEVAAQEKERRAKQKTEKPVKTYSAEDLAAAKGGTFVQLEGSTAPSPAPPDAGRAAARSGSSSTRSGGEAYWRGRIRAARARVAQLTAQVQKLDAQANDSAYGSRSQTKDGPFRDQAERGRQLENLARARRELDQAKALVDQIEEQARREGAPPGWLRD